MIYCFKSIFVFLLLLTSHLVFGQKDVNFIRLNKSFGAVRSVQQDSLGYIWLGGNFDIYKYNGRDFFHTPSNVVFKNEDPQDIIHTTLIDNNGNYWIATRKGALMVIDKNNRYTSYKKELSEINPQTIISKFIPNADDVWMGSANGNILKFNNKTSKINHVASLPLSNGFPQSINCLTFTNSNQLWLSTLEGNIYTYKLQSNQLEALQTDLRKVQHITVASDKTGKLWVATELDGILTYDIKTKSFKKFTNKNLLNQDSEYPHFINAFCDKNNHIWLGTDGDGLYKIDTETNIISNFKHKQSNPFSLNNNTITELFEDTYGNLWCVGKKGNVSILPSQDKNINYYYGTESNIPIPVLSVLKSSDGSLWSGTDGEGINRVFLDGTKVQYNEKKVAPYFFKGKFINSLLEDSKGDIWISTYQNGLWIYNSKSKKFTKKHLSSSKKKYTMDVGVLFMDSKNRIWTSFNDQNNATIKINVFSANKKFLASYDFSSNGLSGKGLSHIAQDEFGTIWLGVIKGGLYEFIENNLDITQSNFKKHKFNVNGNNIFDTNDITTIAPDYSGHLYLITTSGLFMQYRIKEKHFKSFSDNPNFKELYPKSILIEDKNNLWYGNIRGIHHYNVNTNLLASYTQIDGFQNKGFKSRSAFKDHKGYLYFGGEYGVSSFIPSTIHKKKIKAKLYINDIEILNLPAKSLIPEQLNTRIENIQKLRLNYNQSSFSFWFSAISNTQNPNYYYAYRLKGFDENWITSKQNGVASYTNIPHGAYTFEVKASSEKNSWDIKPISLDIYIKPPWWLSKIAYLAYFIISLLIVYGIYLWARLKNKLHKEALLFENEKELYALKMNFFAKMSHEIQTPLTLILGPIEDMMSNAVSSSNALLKQRLLMIKNNANRLSRIALELMSVRNKELKKLRAYVSKNNLIEDLKEISASFLDQASFKKIVFTQEFPTEAITIWYDKDKIEHVFYNLLSNAFKFTPIHGKITLKVVAHPAKEQVEILVQDSGPGIPKEELDHIFKLFYQADLGRNTKGTGIGLALAKELIQLHHGEINVDSSHATGTCFSVKLSTNENTFQAEDKMNIELDASKKSIHKGVDTNYNEYTSKIKKSTKKDSKILIVEDNVEMQIFLQGILNENYAVFIAKDGIEGLELAEKNAPDLILSDVMMPNMDGIEMCNKLQKNKKTSHIPIILLTAKNNSKTKIKGLESGAIEFVQKPFNVYELLLKINNIIETKTKSQLKYKADMVSAPNDIVEKTKDDIFLENLVSELNNQLENPDFKLENLSQKLNMSYSVIYRKCQELTGLTLVEFLRSVRLKKAALLIIKHRYYISEAAFKVGYKDSKYFTKCFKSEFGETPNEFKQKAKTMSVEDLIKKYNLQDIIN